MNNFLMSFLVIFAFNTNLIASDFTEVNPQSKNLFFKLKMKKALKHLKESEHQIGPQTFKFINLGKAKIDLFSDLTYSDYLNVLTDLRREGQELSLSEENYKQLKIEPKVVKELEDLMEGYMWDDRIYVSSKLKAYDLAVTLVHEVNHVLNKSHLVYLDSDLKAFSEEYRAFYVERLFTGSSPKSKDEFLKLKEYVAELYAFPIDLVEKLTDVPKGKIIP